MRKNLEPEMQLLIGLSFQFSFAPIFHFPVPHFPFPVIHFLFPLPFFPTVNNTRRDDVFFPRKALDRQIYLACSTDVGVQIVGSARRGVSRFVPQVLHSPECLEQAERYKKKITRLTQVVVVVIIFNQFMKFISSTYFSGQPMFLPP